MHSSYSLKLLSWNAEQRQESRRPRNRSSVLVLQLSCWNALNLLLSLNISDLQFFFPQSFYDYVMSQCASWYCFELKASSGGSLQWQFEDTPGPANDAAAWRPNVWMCASTFVCTCLSVFPCVCLGVHIRVHALGHLSSCCALAWMKLRGWQNDLELRLLVDVSHPGNGSREDV